MKCGVAFESQTTPVQQEREVSAEEAVRQFFDLRPDADIPEMDFSLTGKDLINFASKLKPIVQEEKQL